MFSITIRAIGRINKTVYNCSQFKRNCTGMGYDDGGRSAFSLSDLKGMFETSKQYTLEENPIKDPLFIFDGWYKEAADCDGIANPSIMCLATCSKKGIPSLRYMFCDSFDAKGFRFFTYSTTRKGEDLENNPYASTCFYWAPLLRTVRVEGPIEKLPNVVSDELFKRRNYISQVNIHSSTQSKRIKSFEVLQDKERIIRAKYDPANVPRPDNFCWYTLKPSVYDFWQLRQKKERVRFRREKPNEVLDDLTRKGERGWVYEFIEP